MQGYRTLLIGLVMAIGTPALTYLAGIDWTKLVGGTWSVVIAGAIMVAMRFFTTTPVGTTDPTK